MRKRSAMLAILWMVWMERNRRIFGGAKEVEGDLLSDEVHLRSPLSISICRKFKDYSFQEFSYD